MRKIRFTVFALSAVLAGGVVHAQDINPDGAIVPKLDVTAPQDLQYRLRAVIQTHPRAEAAQASLEATRARLRAADKALYNPELELDSERTDINTSYIQLSQTIDWRNQRGARTQVAQSELDGGLAEFTLARQTLARDLLVALAEDHTSQALVNVAKQALELMQSFADIAQQRHRAGDLSQVELDLARLAYAEAIIRAAQTRTAAADTRERLRALYQDLPATLPQLPESMPTANLPEDIDGFVSKLPTVQALQAQVAASQHLVSLRQSERSWDPTFALRGGREDKETLAGLTVTIPLNVRNTFRAEVEAAQQDLIENEQTTQQAFRDQRARVLASTEQLRLLQEAWNDWRKIGHVSVSRQVDSLNRLWRAGDMSTAEYLVQLKQALDTLSAGVELRGRLWQNGFDWLLNTALIDAWLNLNKTESNQNEL